MTNANEVEAEYRLPEGLYDEQPGQIPDQPAGVHIHTTDAATGLRYIPYANPYVSKLAGLAARVVAEHGCDLIYAYYLEPYGVAAQLASNWSSTPFGLRHAGSDIGHLFRHRDLNETYRRIAREAAFWLAPRSTHRGLQHLGVPADNLYPAVHQHVPTDLFRPDAAALRLDQVAQKLRSTDPAFEHRFDPAQPTIGMYGKCGETKGSFELLRAAAQVRWRLGEVNVVLATSGPHTVVAELHRLARTLELSQNLLVIPFMPHWKVPGFIAACDVVCFLERGFPVGIHRPMVPREVLACGRCLVVSREIAESAGYADRLAHGKNCLVVDPRKTAELADALCRVISDAGLASAMRAAALAAARETEDWTGYLGKVRQTFDQVISDVRERTRAMTVAETQAALARLYVDEAFRQWFYRAPEEALQKYVLTEEEKESIRSIERRMLETFAETLREKRREKVLWAYPLSLQACEASVERIFGRYLDLLWPRPGISVAEQITDFGRFLIVGLETDESTPGYAADLARYELSLNELRLTPVPSDDLLLLDGPEAQGPGDGWVIEGFARPVVAPGVVVLSADWDIPTIARGLEDDADLTAASPSPTCIVLQARGSRTPKAYRFNTMTSELLGLCTGSRTLGQIGGVLAQRVSGAAGDNLQAAVTDMISKLYAMGIVRFECGTVPSSAQG